MSKFEKYFRKGHLMAKPFDPSERWDATVSVSAVDMANGSPRIGDMICRNPDNEDDRWLVSKDFFEKNYTRQDPSIPEENGKLSFGQAIEALKAGHKVARSGWNGKGMFLFLVPGSTFEVNRKPLLGIYPAGTIINYCPHIDMKTADEKVVPWLASQTDVLANDWGIVE